MDKLQQLLYTSLDKSLNGKEKQQLEEALRSSEALRAEKESLLEIRKKMASFEPKFNAGFTDRVMEKIEQEEHLVQKQDIRFYKIFKRVILSGVAAIILLLLSIYFTDGNLSYDSLTGISGYSPETELLSLF